MAEHESSDITTHPPRAAITRERVQPPARVYMTLNDQLYIRSRNALTGVVLRIGGRLLTADGEIVPFQFTHTPATDRSASLEAFQLAEGYLLSCAVFPSTGAPQRGQTFVEIGFLRGIGGAGDIVDVLAKDYVAAREPLAFPGSPIHTSLEGPGAIRSITGSNPAAGVEISETVPTNARWQLRTFRATLTVDATVASRFPQLQITDGAVLVYIARAFDAQTASLARTYNYLQHGFFLNGNALAQHHGLLPVASLTAATVIATNTSAFQAGDDWAAPTFLVEEWIED